MNFNDWLNAQIENFNTEYEMDLTLDRLQKRHYEILQNLLKEIEADRANEQSVESEVEKLFAQILGKSINELRVTRDLKRALEKPD